MSLDSPCQSDVFPVPDIVPIFPLPNVVFFPYTYLPLHVFEPRYREMVEDVVSGGRCIGMALLKDGWEPQYDQAPPVFELGCVGRIVSLQELPDGRFNMILEGLHRCAFHEQPTCTSYRQAKVTLFPDFPRDPLDSALRSQLTTAAETYLRANHVEELCDVITSGKLSDQVLVNSLSAGLDFTTFEKQFLLESEHLPQQARRLLDLLRFKLADLPSTQE